MISYNVKQFLTQGCRSHTNWRAVRVSLVVGTVLNLINNHDVLFGAGWGTGKALQIGLTYLVPYLVSMHGQVTAVLHAAKQE